MYDLVKTLILKKCALYIIYIYNVYKLQNYVKFQSSKLLNRFLLNLHQNMYFSPL